MARPNNPIKPERLLTQRPFGTDNVEASRHVVPFWLEAKGVDRFHESTRVGPQHATRMRNFMFEDGVLISRRGTDLMGGAAASTVLQVVDFVRANTKKVTIRFCTRHLEIFEYGTGSWRSFAIPFTGSEKDLFAWTGWADKLIFSNGIDGLWEFDFKTLVAKIIPGGPSAKHLTTFGNRVVASATTEKGSSFPLRIRWSEKNNYLKWDPDVDIGAGFEDFYGSPGGATDEVMGVFPYTDEAAWVVRDRSVWQFSVSGNAIAPFRPSRYLANVGSPFRHSICEIPGGIVFTSRDNVHVLGVGTHERVGDLIVDEIFEELETLRFSYAAYDVGRQEYRLAGDNLVFRYRFQEQGWTVDEYPFPIKSLSRQIQGKAGIPIDNLSGTIDELEGTIDELVYLRESDDSMMFVPNSTLLTVRETDDDQDTLLTGEKTDSELEIVSGVINTNPLHAIELHEILMEYLSEMDQQLLFDYTLDDGSSFIPLSVKDIETTLGSEMLSVKKELVSRKLQIRLRSLALGKLRLLGMAPHIVKVERNTMAAKKPKVASIEVLPSPLSLVVGGTQPLSIIMRAANGSVVSGRRPTIVSTNNSIATVSSTGTVRAIAEGSFAVVVSVGNIQVSVGGTVNAVAVAAVATVTVTPAISQGASGTQQQFTATVRDANGVILLGRTIVWASSTPGFATINSSGLATLVAAGVTAISATVEGITGGATLTVTASAAVVDHVDVSPSTFSGDVGETVQLVAAPKDASNNTLSGKTITWDSDNDLIATVSATGLVTLVGVGSVIITATCETIDGTSSGTVTAAEEPVSTVTMTPSSINIAAGATQQMTVVLRDVDSNILTGRVIVYSSNNTSVATVDQNGLVTGVAAGSATITATSEGKLDTSPITVTAIPVASVTVSPSSFTLGAGLTTQLVATPKDASNNVLTGRVVTWGTSDPTKATVSSSGVVTGVAAGSVTITATCETKQGTSAGTIGAATYSPLNANTGVTYVPEPNPQDCLIELPRVYLSSRHDNLSFASTVTLTNSGNRLQNTNALQAAIDAAAARAGHSEIRLPSPFPHQTYRVRKHAFAGSKTVITAVSLPSLDFVRANAALMTSSPECQIQNAGENAQIFDAGADNTYFVGLSFSARTGISIIYDMILVQAPNATIAGDVPNGIWFDRCLVRGNDAGVGVPGFCRNGITYNGKNGGVVDCVIDQIGNNGQESHAIIVYNTPGPVKIENNKLEASSIGFLCGGAFPDLGASAGKPTDGVLRRNLFTRRLQWAKDGPQWDGVTGRGIKNQIEFKNAERWLVEGNVVENNWADGQTGNIIVVKSGVGQGPTAAGNGSANITVRHNKTRNSTRYISLHGLSDETTATPMNKCAVFNNLAYDIGQFAGQNVGTIAWLLTQFIDDLYVANNTTVLNNTAREMQFAYADASNKSERFIYRDNINEADYYWSDTAVGTAAINSWAAAGYTWERNVTVMHPDNWAASPGGTNQYDNVRTDIGYEDITNKDFRLDAASPYKGDGLNGADPGADIDKIDLATQDVAPVTTPCNIITSTAGIAQSGFLKPAYVTPTNEPDFGTKFTRITGDVGVAVPTVGGTWPSLIYHNYAKDPVWSADQALLVLKQTSAAFGAGWALFLDGSTYAPLFTRGGPSGGGEWRMHPTLPNIAVYLNSSGLIGHWNVSTNVSTTKVPADAAYNSAEIGPFEGNVSYNGRWIAPKMIRIADGNLVAQLVDIDNNVRSTVIDLTAANITSLDWVSISALAGYIVAYGTIDGVDQRTKVWNATTGALVAYWTDHIFGHFDLGVDVDGNEVAFGSVASGIHVHKFIMRNLSTGTVTVLSGAWTSFNWHASTRNNLRQGWGYASINDDTGYLLDLEVVAIKLSATNQIERLGRHRTNNVDYDSAAFACPSPDGKRVVFGSNWGEGGGTGRPVAAYVIDVRDICP